MSGWGLMGRLVRREVCKTIVSKRYEIDQNQKLQKTCDRFISGKPPVEDLDI
jgi:hypothetical protein